MGDSGSDGVKLPRRRLTVERIFLIALLLVGIETTASPATFDDAMVDRPGDIDRARVSRQLIRSDPESPLGYFGLSYTLYQMGQLELALAVFERFESVPNENLNYVYENKGVVLMRLGRYDEARKALEKALALDPNFGHAHFTLAVLQIWTDGDVSEILRHLEVADANDGVRNTKEFHRVYRAAALYKLKRYPEALAELNAAILRIPEDYAPLNYPTIHLEALYEAHYFKARVLKELGRRDEAVVEMQRVFSLRDFRLKMPVAVRASNSPPGNWPCFEDPGLFASLFHRWELP